MTDRRVAVITGAGSAEGIGFATARRLVAAGYALMITSTTDRIVERARELGGDVASSVADLTDAEQADRVVAETVDRFGRLHVLVNNAGMTPVGGVDEPAPVHAISDEQWRTALARNLDTALFMTRAAAPHLRSAGTGRVVMVSSVSGPVMAFDGDVGYHAAKAAMVGMTRSAALDLARDGVTVNAVAPGWIATATSPEHELVAGRATPAGRPGTTDEVATLIEFLASASASYVTGQTIVVDGGNSIAEVRG